MPNNKIVIKQGPVPKELVLVEYPGIVNNPDNAIRTLGGIQNISRVAAGEKKRLDLKFSRQNPFNKPAYGDVHPTSGLVLKIKVKKSQLENSSDTERISGEIVGYVKKEIKFKNPSDYQYLPVLKNPKTGTDECIQKNVVPEGIPPNDWHTENPNQQLFCVPAMFSRDSVQKNLFRNDNNKELPDDTMGIPPNRRNDEKESYITFSLNEPIPSAAPQGALKRMSAKLITDGQLETVKKLFDTCPIWTRIALIYETGISNDKMKFILPSLAYYYTTGPWRSMHVRYGYDPRKNFESRFQQVFDFRLRASLGMKEFIKLRICAQRETKAREKAGRNAKSDENVKERIQNVDYPYLDDTTFPRSRQVMLRYCDIRVTKVQQMLQKIPTPLPGGGICHEKMGWLPHGFDDQCRQILTRNIKDRFQSLLKETQIQEEEVELLSEEEEEAEDYQDTLDDIEEEMEIEFNN